MITVVTPWYMHPELMAEYNTAICAAGCPDVVIIDNGNAPKFAPTWAHWYAPTWAHYIDRGKNLGFARASNLGLGWAKTDAVLFLNNDIRMTSPDWLLTIKDELAPGVLVGAELAAPPYTMVDGCHIPYLAGWCLAGMTEDLRSLGGFDETFEEPAYFGDNDLCLRARRAGMRLVAAPVGLKHLGNVTSRSMDVSGVSARNYERYAARARELLAVA